MNRQSAEQSLREGDPVQAMQQLQELVRADPADATLRIFLFQLLAVLGDWERAATQLAVAAELEPSALAMAQMYGEAIRCEGLRAQVFAGSKIPHVFGEPEEWLALLVESMLVACRGQPQQATRLREMAFEQAPASSGTIDGRGFAWLADADSRLGPVLEVIINGKYYWVPFTNLSRIVLEAPADLRDVVWMPAQFRFSNGGEAVGLIPARYPGSESCDDGQLRLARKTIWREAGADLYYGLGQRMLVTDAGEVSLMDVREIEIAAGAG
jgi:type VI secretion system protein ImpE